MKYLLLLILLIIYFLGSSKAQIIKVNSDSITPQKKTYNNRIDSLKQLIANAPNDTIKVRRLIRLSNEQRNDFGNATIEYAEKAKLLAEKLQYNQGLAMSYQAIGNFYQLKGNYKIAIAYYQTSIDFAEEDPTLEKLEFYSPLLNLYFYLGDYLNAMKAVTNQIEGFEKLKNKKGIAHCNNLLGYIYFKQEDFGEAEKYYVRYINNARELNDSSMIGHALGELADVFIKEKKYELSLTVLSTAMRIFTLFKSSGGQFNNGLINQMQAKAFYRLSQIYKSMGDFHKALKFSLAAIDSSLKNSTNKYEKAGYYINAGDVYKELKNYNKAISYLTFGFNLSREIQHRENIRDAAEHLAETYTLQSKNDSAFYFYRLFVGLKDSIINNETKMKIAGIQGQYDMAKKDKEIVRQKEIRNILIGSFILLLISLVFLDIYYRLKQKNSYHKKLNFQQNELFNTIAAAQDEERKRIAQDIHDGLGSILSAAKLNLSSLKESRPLLSNEQITNAETTMQLLDEASVELRSISHNIMPATLSKLGLIAALKNLTYTISSNSDLQIDFSAHYFTVRINEQIEMSIYRITLELINNIVKHAQANKVTVQLIKYPHYINLLVEDNGQGFDYKNALLEKNGMGLVNILSRVDYLKAKMNVDASPGRGTIVIIDVPLENVGT